MKIKRLFKGTSFDFPDLIIERMVDFREVTLDEFNKAVAEESYNGKKVIAAIETENFGYFKTDDNQIYRC